MLPLLTIGFFFPLWYRIGTLCVPAREPLGARRAAAGFFAVVGTLLTLGVILSSR